uniref:CSON009948 protein n=1 Tax=Culicoides sonorensis TaxID=179676 RepID=A0A336LL94_CULSO
MIRPAGYSDSEEDEYDDFDLGYDRPKREPFQPIKSTQDELEETMYRALSDGDLEGLKLVLESVNINLDDRFRHGYSLLMYACMEAQAAIVKFLIEKGATVNMEIESYTPLMMACRSEGDSTSVAQIVKDLLENGAVINQSNIYGDTPLIFACQNGHTEVVKMMIKEASLDSTNNQTGNSAIFYAVEKNCLEIVKMLLEHGASYTIPNRKGYIPKVIADMHGFFDIVALFPKKEEEEYQIPTSYTTIRHYTDLVPGILHKPIAPPYFYRIREILIGLELEILHKPLAKADVSLPQLLTMNETKLEEVGVKLPILQKKLMLGLFKFHSHKWSKKSISSITNESRVDTFHVYSMMAGHLQHLVVLRSSLVFLFQLIKDRKFPEIEILKAVKILRALDKYLQELEKLFWYMEKIRQASPVTLIDEITPEKADVKPNRRMFLSKLTKYSAVFGVVTIVGLILRAKLK